MLQFRPSKAWWILAAGLLVLAPVQGAEADAELFLKQLRQVQQQNELLQQQVRKQQELIEELSRKVSKLANDSPVTGGTALTQTKSAEEPAATPSPSGFSLGKVHISGEGSVGFFHSGSDGQFPNHEFRVDEAKLFVEAPIWKEVYFFTEVNLVTREEASLDLHVGELYVDFENVSRLWDRENQLNLRAGRMDIPFGEEYLVRDSIDNPLVSHSLMDLWGVDEGVELYGKLCGVNYVAAVQNGSHDGLRDFTDDKAFVLRVGYDPNRLLHLSASAMRTGKLDVKKEHVSELWLGNGFVRSLGSSQTKEFEANLLQGDVSLKFPHTTVRAAGGVLQYDDDDPAASNRRSVYYYYVEGVQDIYKGLYAATRWSQVFANDGFPLAANGNVEKYGFHNDALTHDLWRLSLGLGYRFDRRLVVKTEYTIDRGTLVNGARRNKEDMVSVVVAFAF